MAKVLIMMVDLPAPGRISCSGSLSIEHHYNGAAAPRESGTDILPTTAFLCKA
jgi:hypothetical protein